MIIIKDGLTGDEVLSDAYKLESEEDDFLMTCNGKMIQRKIGGGISDDLIGGNKSQEEAQEEADDSESVESGIDIVLEYKLVDQSDYFTSKKVVQSYLKKWVKNLVDGEMMKSDEAKCSKFKSQCGKSLKKFLDLFTDDSTVYTGPHFDPEECKAALMIGVWSEDGLGIKMYMIKSGFEEEKC